MWPLPLEYTQGSAVLWLSEDVLLNIQTMNLSTDEYLRHWSNVQHMAQ